MWVRGLKLAFEVVNVLGCKVAPYVGAWIETSDKKFNRTTNTVAPYVGAWIETLLQVPALFGSRVAPYVGAWIETIANVLNSSKLRSHPMWVRGLKLELRNVAVLVKSRTLCGCVD